MEKLTIERLQNKCKEVEEEYRLLLNSNWSVRPKKLDELAFEHDKLVAEITKRHGYKVGIYSAS